MVQNNNLPSNKKFGYTFALIFLLLGILFFLKGSSLSYIFIFLSLVFYFTALLFSQILNPLNLLWSKLGYFLSIIFSPIVLGIIFFIILTPYALILRLFGRDELDLKKDSNDTSYWINSSKSKKFDISYFRKQF